jgi:SsrA-binding protein
MKTEFKNKKVNYEYFIIDKIVGGIKLQGSEVKAIRLGKVSLTDTYCYLHNNELYLKGMYIGESNVAYSHTAIRDRKLLLKKREINKLYNEGLKGYTILPYRLFINDRGLVKVELVIGKGKKLWDKRETIKTRDLNRELKKEI